MESVQQGRQNENAQVVLGLLESVGRDGDCSQRRLASELGIALGLVNAYLKRCVKKGYIKMREAPARRYTYYLTPTGFAEKSRLTAEYLSVSFGFFRQAKADCTSILVAAAACGLSRLVLLGKSDLAEIAALCAMDTGIRIVAVVEAGASSGHFVGSPIVATLSDVPEPFDAVLVTDLTSPNTVHGHAVLRMGRERVLVPQLLRGRIHDQAGLEP